MYGYNRHIRFASKYIQDIFGVVDSLGIISLSWISRCGHIPKVIWINI